MKKNGKIAEEPNQTKPNQAHTLEGTEDEKREKEAKPFILFCFVKFSSHWRAWTEWIHVDRGTMKNRCWKWYVDRWSIQFFCWCCYCYWCSLLFDRFQFLQSWSNNSGSLDPSDGHINWNQSVMNSRWNEMIDLYCVRAMRDLFMCSRNNKNTKQNRSDKRRNQWFFSWYR